MSTSKYTVVALGIIGALALSGCAATSPAPDPDSSTSTEEVEEWLVGQQTTTRPSHLDDKGQLAGPLPELVAALQAPLGVAIEQEGQSWENILLGMEKGTYAFAPAAAITAERLEKFDFAVMQSHVYSFRVKQGNPEIGKSMDDLCGLDIALTASASVIPILEEQSEICENDGAAPITISSFNDWASADLAVQSGQADVSTRPLVELEYEQEQMPGAWEITGPEYFRNHLGLAIPRGSANGPRLVEALNALIAEGTYQEIFDEWGIGASKVDESYLATRETYEFPE